MPEPLHREKDILWLRKNLEEQLYRAFKASFPFFSYKEVKNLVKAQYYRLIVELREVYSWDELSTRLATTQQGLRKLGDAVLPRLEDNEIRAVLLLVQEAGDAGMALSELAARYYRDRGSRPGRLSLDESVRCLLETGDVVERRGRLHAGTPELDLSTDTIRALLTILQSHPQGMTLEALAAAYYGLSPRPPGSFDDALESLQRVGDVIAEREVLRAATPTQVYTREGGVSLETVLSIVNTTSRIGDVVASGSGQMTAGLWRVTLSVPEGEEAGRAFLKALRDAVGTVVKQAEATDRDEPKQTYTVVLGAAPSLL